MSLTITNKTYRKKDHVLNDNDTPPLGVFEKNKR